MLKSNCIHSRRPTYCVCPDKNLGKYLIAETGRDMVLWEGSCIVHEAFF